MRPPSWTIDIVTATGGRYNDHVNYRTTQNELSCNSEVCLEFVLKLMAMMMSGHFYQGVAIEITLWFNANGESQ